MTLSKLIEDINSAVGSADKDVTKEQRSQLIEACDALRSAYEDPMTLIFRLIFVPQQLAALRIAVGMGIFDVAASFKGEEADLKRIVSGTNGDPLLTRRIIRMLSAMGLFKETEQGGFMLTPLGAGFVTMSPLSDAVVHFSHQTSSIVELPKYLEKTGYKNPDDAYDGPFQFAFHTDAHAFDHLKTLPREQKAFNAVMAFSRAMKGKSWFEFYPVEERLNVASDSETLLIDVGGGTGHDLVEFKKIFPNLPGKLITQDVPAAIDDIKELPAGIEGMKHDFFTPQPIKGAKAYFLRHILHDWPDKQAKQVLEHLRDAMSKDSILFIEETELPETNVSLRAACMDMTMMAAFSAMERTREQFKQLLESVGLVLVKTWTPEPMTPGQDTLFEAVLKA